MCKVFMSLIFLIFSDCCLAQTQAEMNKTAGDNYAKADKQLNNIYKKIISDYKNDAVFIKNFKVAQRLWLQFRDAELKARYPERPAGYYGSIQPF